MSIKIRSICIALAASVLGFVQSLEASPPAGKEAEPREIIEAYTRAVMSNGPARYFSPSFGLRTDGCEIGMMRAPQGKQAARP